MKSIKVCEYSRSRSFHYDLILQDQASGERSQDQWSSGIMTDAVRSGERSLVSGEYQIYFTECVENIRIFTSAKKE